MPYEKIFISIDDEKGDFLNRIQSNISKVIDDLELKVVKLEKEVESLKEKVND